jgi:uncharacterized protein (DUF1778 family)
MKFNSENAAKHGRKGGLATKPPDVVRKTQLNLKMSESEKFAIEEKAKKRGSSIVDFVLEATKAYKEK